MIEDNIRANNPDVSEKDAELLKEIRETYAAYKEYWRDAQEHREKCIRYLSGDPWSEADKRARQDLGRPCISHDELNQYVNQCVNAKRQNRTGIKIEPEGNGANDKTAELRQNLARTIEYKSQAQAAYLKAYQDEVEGAYGFLRVTRRYVNNDSDQQEIVIKSIPNPDSVLYDPMCKEPDWKDAERVFILEPMTREQFKREFPGAIVQSFSTDDMNQAPDWITDKTVLVAEYWKVEKTQRKSKAPSGRTVWDKRVVQYITNGVEILEVNPQIGEEIPIPAFIGMERYRNEGSGAKRQLFALPSLALDPQMSLAYYASQAAEEAGMTPKTPFVGYVGQFETDAEAWSTATKQPHAMLQADPVVDAATGAVLPLPQQRQFTPNFGAYELAMENSRRAIQAAMGISPLPTSAQRQNDKSGVALGKIQQAQEVGSFHFADGFDRAIARTGRIINSWLPAVYDTDIEISVQLPNETRKTVRLTTGTPMQGAEGDPEQHQLGDEEHSVTISTGPSAVSQREVADQFGDLLVSKLDVLPIPPPSKAKLLSMVVKSKQLGPRGDEMAEIISPTQDEELPPQAQQLLSQAQQEIQQVHAYAQQLEQKVQALEFEKKAKIVEHQGDLELERLKQEGEITRAEITTKFQSLEERLKTFEDMQAQFHQQAHEAQMQADQQAHEMEMAQRSQEAAAAQQQPENQQEEQQEQPEQ